MATEILVNDGGAPARILPFTVAASSTAGHLVSVSDADEVTMSASGVATGIGYMFVDAQSGSNGSVITGKGVILNLKCTGTVAAGNSLTAAAGGVSQAQPGSDTVYAIALGALASGAGFVKSITL